MTTMEVIDLLIFTLVFGTVIRLAYRIMRLDHHLGAEGKKRGADRCRRAPASRISRLCRHPLDLSP